MNRRLAAIEALERRLGYVFGDRELLDRALTHASAAGGSARIASNERLEFLGDRVLGLIIADALVGRDEAANVGDLSKRLHVLVSGDVCAQVARTIGLGDALRLQGASPLSAARDNSTILADACEALIAALYLELGLERTSSIVLEMWERFFIEPFDPGQINPKSELQEWAAAGGHSHPVYRVLSRSGPDHRPMFTVEVSLGTFAPVTAEGRSVRIAEKAAALALLTRERNSS
jgi:ribonuclease-3